MTLPAVNSGSEDNSLPTLQEDVDAIAGMDDNTNNKDEHDDESTHCSEEDDAFDAEAISLPHMSSSTIPIVIDVSNKHRNTGFYSSSDPLFQGFCLYTTTASGSDCGSGTIKSTLSSSKPPPPPLTPGISSVAPTAASSSQRTSGELDHLFLPSVFRFLLRSS